MTENKKFKKGDVVYLQNAESYGKQRILTGSFQFDSYDNPDHIFVLDKNLPSGTRFRVKIADITNLPV